MRILFFGGRGWGFSQDMYDYVFKPMGARQHQTSKGVDWRYFGEVMFHDYDLIWCEGEASHLACLNHYLFKAYTVHMLRRLYRSNRAKIISRFHFHDVEPYLKEFKWKAIMALTYSDKPVCVSEYWRSECMRLLPVYKDTIDLSIVHNGVDTAKYVPNSELKQSNTIFYLAVTTPRKRLHLLIQAMKYLKDWKLVVGGTFAQNGSESVVLRDPTIPAQCQKGTAYWEWCHGLGKPFKDRIAWVGFLSEEEKIRMYQAATVFCLPSRVESWGVTPMEAMACGTLSVTTNTGGLSEFVPQQQLLPASPTPRDIADKVHEVSRHPEWNEQNREIAMSFDWRQIAREAKSVIDEIIN